MKTKLLDVIAIHCSCCAGAEISQCCAEAISLAIETGELVAFIHNEKKYVANPKTLVMEILKQNE
jgi:hypothetical protein